MGKEYSGEARATPAGGPECKVKQMPTRVENPCPSGRGPLVITVTSGKGGVGKTMVVANLAMAMAGLGKKVLLIDADLGIANLNLVFGLTLHYNLNHYFNMERTLDEVLVQGPAGIKLLPAGSGSQEITRLSPEQKVRFLEELDHFQGMFDVVLIDTAAGISDNVTYFSMAAQEILLVTTPEPTALAGVRALADLLASRYHERRFRLLVNQADSKEEALEAYNQLLGESRERQDFSVDYLGYVPPDIKVCESIRRQRPLLDLYPESATGLAFSGLADILANLPNPTHPKGGLQMFWRTLLARGD